MVRELGNVEFVAPDKINSRFVCLKLSECVVYRSNFIFRNRRQTKVQHIEDRITGLKWSRQDMLRGVMMTDGVKRQPKGY